MSLVVTAMNKKLFIQAIGKYLTGLIVLAILLFVPAGSFSFPNAWLINRYPLYPYADSGSSPGN